MAEQLLGQNPNLWLYRLASCMYMHMSERLEMIVVYLRAYARQSKIQSKFHSTVQSLSPVHEYSPIQSPGISLHFPPVYVFTLHLHLFVSHLLVPSCDTRRDL